MKGSYPEVNVLIGIPGSGKSHWIGENSTRRTHLVVCPDDIRHNIFGGINDQANNSRVFDIAKGMIMAGIHLKKDIILDATNCNTTYRRDFLKDLPYCHKIATLFEIDPKTAFERIQKGLRNSELRSDVPESVVYRMYGEYLYTKTVLKQEHFRKLTLIDVLTGKETELERY